MKKVLLLQSDLEGARLRRLILERFGIEFLREGALVGIQRSQSGGIRSDDRGH